MLHQDATVDEGRQGDKACFNGLACQEPQADRKISVSSVAKTHPTLFLFSSLKSV